MYVLSVGKEVESIANSVKQWAVKDALAFDTSLFKNRRNNLFGSQLLGRYKLSI